MPKSRTIDGTDARDHILDHCDAETIAVEDDRLGRNDQAWSGLGSISIKSIRVPGCKASAMGVTVPGKSRPGISV